MESYNYPIDTNNLMKATKLPRISIEESVRRHVYIILMTNFGEYRFDRDYGCGLWNHDFDISVNDNAWTSNIENTLRQNIQSNEPRIASSFKVHARVEKQNEDEKDLRRQFIIAVSNMVLIETNEKINNVEYAIIFSPISIF